MRPPSGCSRPRRVIPLICTQIQPDQRKSPPKRFLLLDATLLHCGFSCMETESVHSGSRSYTARLLQLLQLLLPMLLPLLWCCFGLARTHAWRMTQATYSAILPGLNLGAQTGCFFPDVIFFTAPFAQSHGSVKNGGGAVLGSWIT